MNHVIGIDTREDKKNTQEDEVNEEEDVEWEGDHNLFLCHPERSEGSLRHCTTSYAV